MSNIKMIHGDCMDIMKQYPDKYFQLACVDPPYGIGAGGGIGGDKLGKVKRYKNGEWDFSIPKAEYFKELKRVSVNQIIWGGNYFIDYLENTPCMIVWNKKNGTNYFADCEIAWTSFDTAVRMFEYMWQGMLQGDMKNKEQRLHPTQKPVALYKWLLSRYAKPGDKILDTHGGSGSICIACHDLGYDLTWMELDADYYAAACERYRIHAAQALLFEPKPIAYNQGEL